MKATTYLKHVICYKRCTMHQKYGLQQIFEAKSGSFRDILEPPPQYALSHSIDHAVSERHNEPIPLEMEFSSSSFSKHKKFLKIYWNKHERSYTLRILKTPNSMTMTSFRSKNVHEILKKIHEFMASYQNEV